MEEIANERVEAIGRANLEAEAATVASMREEADRLLEEHRNRAAQLQEEMKVRHIHTKYAFVVGKKRCISCQTIRG